MGYPSTFGKIEDRRNDLQHLRGAFIDNDTPRAAKVSLQSYGIPHARDGGNPQRTANERELQRSAERRQADLDWHREVRANNPLEIDAIRIANVIVHFPTRTLHPVHPVPVEPRAPVQRQRIEARTGPRVVDMQLWLQETKDVMPLRRR